MSAAKKARRLEQRTEREGSATTLAHAAAAPALFPSPQAEAA